LVCYSDNVQPAAKYAIIVTKWTRRRWNTLDRFACLSYQGRDLRIADDACMLLLYMFLQCFSSRESIRAELAYRFQAMNFQLMIERLIAGFEQGAVTILLCGYIRREVRMHLSNDEKDQHICTQRHYIRDFACVHSIPFELSDLKPQWAVRVSLAGILLKYKSRVEYN
jgi:hypothetical protein